MNTEEIQFTTLRTLARTIGLPKPFLRRLAREGQIPSLNVDGRLRFNPKAVQTALDTMAERKGFDHA